MLYKFLIIVFGIVFSYLNKKNEELKNVRFRIWVFFCLYDVDVILMIYICKCICMWVIIVNLRVELYVDEINEILNYIIEY